MEKIFELLHTVVWNGFTLQDILVVGAGLLFLIFVIRVVAGLFGKKEDKKHVETVECYGCGWKGGVSKFAGACPKCNQPLGERKSRPRR